MRPEFKRHAGVGARVTMLLLGGLALFATDCVAQLAKHEWVVAEVTDESGEGTGTFFIRTIVKPHGKRLDFPYGDAVAILRLDCDGSMFVVFAAAPSVMRPQQDQERFNIQVTIDGTPTEWTVTHSEHPDLDQLELPGQETLILLDLHSRRVLAKSRDAANNPSSSTTFILAVPMYPEGTVPWKFELDGIGDALLGACLQH